MRQGQDSTLPAGTLGVERLARHYAERVTGSVDAASIAATKTMLRQVIRRRRAGRDPGQRQRDDEQRFERLQGLLRTRRPRRLAAYLSADTEPDSRRLVDWVAGLGVPVALPVLTDGAGQWLPSPAWAPYEGVDRLREGRSGILEPVGSLLPEGVLAGVDLIIVPGLAADRQGNRLGRGGGWYDRARSGRVVLETWLLLNDDEVLDEVPADAWDLPVDLIVTPSQAISTPRRTSR